MSSVQASPLFNKPCVSGNLTTPSAVPASGAIVIPAAYAGSLNAYYGGLVYDPTHNTYALPEDTGVYRVVFQLAVVGPTITSGLCSIAVFNASNIFINSVSAKVGIQATVNNSSVYPLQLDIDTSGGSKNIAFYVSTVPAVQPGTPFSIDRISI